MRVGILDILALPSRHPAETVHHLIMTKQYASITPQAVSVWCRQLGHKTFYATYCGVGDPGRRLPPDLDVVFIACYTQASAMAYALAKIYRRAGTRTVIGGPALQVVCGTVSISEGLNDSLFQPDKKSG